MVEIHDVVVCVYPVLAHIFFLATNEKLIAFEWHSALINSGFNSSGSRINLNWQCVKLRK